MTFSHQRRYRGPIQAALLDGAATTMDHDCMAPAVVFSRADRMPRLDDIAARIARGERP